MQFYETFYSLWFHKKFHFSIHLEDDQIDGTTMETVTNFIFWASIITADCDCSHEIMLTPWKESYDQPRQHIKKQRQYFIKKGPSHQGYSFSSSHVRVGP